MIAVFLIILFVAYKVISLALVVFAVRMLIRQWRRKAVRDIHIQLVAFTVVSAVFQILNGWAPWWAQAYVFAGVVAIGIWHYVSLYKETKQLKREASKIEKTLEAMMTEEAILTMERVYLEQSLQAMMVERERRKKEIKAIEQAMEMEARQQ